MELELDLLVDAMGPRRVWKRGGLFEQVRLFRREGERWIDCNDFGKWRGTEGEREL